MSDPKITSQSATRFGEGVRSLPWRQSTLLPGGVCCCLGCTSPVVIPNNQAGNHWCFYANSVSAKTSNRTWGPRMASPDQLNITIPVKISHLSLIRCDFLNQTLLSDPTQCTHLREHWGHSSWCKELKRGATELLPLAAAPC